MRSILAAVGLALALVGMAAAATVPTVPYWSVKKMNTALVRANPQYAADTSSTLQRATCTGLGRAKRVNRVRAFNAFRCAVVARERAASSSQSTTRRLTLWSRPRPGSRTGVCVSRTSLAAIAASGCLGKTATSSQQGDPRVCSLNNADACLLQNAKLATRGTLRNLYNQPQADAVIDCSGSGLVYRCPFHGFPVGGGLTVAGTSTVTYQPSQEKWGWIVVLTGLACADGNGRPTTCPPFP